MQRIKSSCVLGALALLSLLLAYPAGSDVPSTMSFQGVLTDGSGNVLPDGNYDLAFSLYAAPLGGVPLWTETQSGVAVVKGGFAVILGSVNPLLPAPFSFGEATYLGTSVDGGAELSPRIALSSSPYALSLRVPFGARDTSSSPLIAVTNLGAGPDLKAGGFLSLGASGIVNPEFGIFPSAGGYLLAAMLGLSSGGYFALYEENVAGPAIGDITVLAAPSSSGEGGTLVVYGGDDTGLPQFRVNGNESGSGNPSVTVQGSVSTTIINSNAAGNASVGLPVNAVASPEILDEPGIAQTHSNGAITVPAGATMTDLLTVTLATPAAGFIVVEATAQHAIGGDGVSQNTASLQIDELAGGGVDVNHYVWSGDWPSATGTRYRPITVRRTYFMSTGDAYTFRLEGAATNLAGATNYLWHTTLTAKYYPTAYGFVLTGASQAESRGFDSAMTTSASTEQPGGQGAVVDLRELELRVRRERDRLEAAERALVLAQQGMVPRPEPRRLDAEPKEKQP